MPSRALLVAVIALAVAGCSGSASEGERPGQGADVTVTISPSRLTPFCQAMIELADRLDTGDVVDETQLILDTYLDVLSEVPAAIEEDFRVVIARLQRGDLPELVTTTVTPTTTTRPSRRAATTTTTTAIGDGTADTESDSTLPDAEYEGWTPDDDPAIRVNGYVDFACRDNLNNPGPAATQPVPPELSDTADTADTVEVTG